MTDGQENNAHDDIVDGNVNELDEEADEAHDREADGSRCRNLLIFCRQEI